jgi:hypothetical protein
MRRPRGGQKGEGGVAGCAAKSSRLTVLISAYLVSGALAGCGETKATSPTAETTNTAASPPLIAARAHEIAVARTWAKMRRLGPSADHGRAVEVRCTPESMVDGAHNNGLDAADVERKYHVSSRDFFFQCLVVLEDGHPVWNDVVVRRRDRLFIEDLH